MILREGNELEENEEVISFVIRIVSAHIFPI